MPKFLRQFMLVGAIPVFLWPTIACAQDKDTDEAQAIEAVAGLLNKEIQAGKLTKAQAISYVKCSQQDFRAAFLESPDGIKMASMLKSSADADGETVVDKEMLEKMKTQIPDINKTNRLLQDQAEERCMKKLGVQVPVGKIWGRQ